MCYEKSVSVTDTKLVIWNLILKAVRKSGFDIQFGIEYFKKVVCNFYSDNGGEPVDMPWETYVVHPCILEDHSMIMIYTDEREKTGLWKLQDAVACDRGRCPFCSFSTWAVLLFCPLCEKCRHPLPEEIQDDKELDKGFLEVNRKGSPITFPLRVEGLLTSLSGDEMIDGVKINVEEGQG